MKATKGTILALIFLGMCSPAIAQAPGTARPRLVLKEAVRGMPHGEKQEVRVLTATFKPGDRSGAQPLRLVIFYASDPDTPFLDPVR